MAQRTCLCGANFDISPNERNPRKWCSERCRAKTMRQLDIWRIREMERQGQRRRREEERARAGTPISYADCIECGRLFVLRPAHRGKITCSPQCYWRRGNRIANQDARRLRKREANARRRAARRGAQIERFEHVEIFERDGWICGICREPVDPDVRYPDIQSASLDHVVPISKGGMHTAENVQLAHFGCNSRKRDRLAS